MRDALPLLVFLLGLSALVYGIWQLSPAGAWVAGGAALVVLSWWWERARP